jgi:DNA-binding response OmpR family regulator
MSRNRILVVEDEPHIAEPLADRLIQEGLDPTRVATIADARNAYDNNTFDLIILDVHLPDGSGFDFCKEIRRGGDKIHIIILTALSDEIDEVRGLEIGADDYVKKDTVSLKALSIKIKNYLTKNRDTESRPCLSHLQLVVDKNKKRITFKGKNLELTSREYSILSLLCKYPGQPYSPEEIIDKCWEGDITELNSQAVAFHIKNIRKKIKAIDPQTNPEKDVLVNQVGIGYALKEG